jgi:hypothetical protein
MSQPSNSNENKPKTKSLPRKGSLVLTENRGKRFTIIKRHIKTFEIRRKNSLCEVTQSITTPSSNQK